MREKFTDVCMPRRGGGQVCAPNIEKSVKFGDMEKLYLR